MSDRWGNSAADHPREPEEPGSGSESGSGPESGSDFHLELDGKGTLREQIMRALREAIGSGRLAPGTRLPPYRSLARDLGLALNTVGEAYGELVAEGWLVARQGSGTASRGAAHRCRRTTRAVRRRRSAAPSTTLMPTSPDAATFPRPAWQTSARRALHAAPNDAFGVGDPRGRVELRTALTEYLARARGVRTAPHRIIVCAGFAHALSMLGQVLDGAVAVESYGLGFHRSLLTGAGRRTVPLAVDARGAVIDELPATGAEAVLLTPAHQFPTGGPLHPERRAAVIDWARTGGGLVIEDDYDGEFRYDRQPVGAVQGLDPDRVVYIGSTSKSLSPALRIGWMAVPDRLVDDVLSVKGARELWTGSLEQLTLADFIACGDYDRHLRRMRLKYRRRRDRLVATLGARAPHIGIGGIAAGSARRPRPAARHRTNRGARGVPPGPRSRRPRRLPPSRPRQPPRDGLVIGYGTPPDHAFDGRSGALCLALPEPEQPHGQGPASRGGRPAGPCGDEAECPPYR